MDYQSIVERAMRSVVHDILNRVADDGLPGQHHLYVTFDTRHPGVGLTESLARQYPDEMTIVLQHQFWGLDVDEDAFEVTLKFSGRNERLRIPLEAVKAFADPSVNFGLRFHAAEESVPEEEAERPDETSEEAAIGAPEAGEIVTLDAFRKKKT